MNIFHLYKNQILAELQKIYTVDQAILAQITLEAPRDRSHGDLALNAALILAKPLGKAPRDLAQEIAINLTNTSDFASVEIAGPGFINIRLVNRVWTGVLETIRDLGSRYGQSNIGKGEAVNIEFVSANPTGPMHIGHARGAVVGDVLANLLNHCGYNVTREYYINDAGAQIEVLARSLFIRYQQQCGIAAEIPTGCYPGDYLIPIAESLYQQHEKGLLNMPQDKCTALLGNVAIKAMLELIRADLSLLGVSHDVFRSEQHDIRDRGKLAEGIGVLEKKGVMYRGMLEAPKGKTPEDWEPREQSIFRATDFGDDVDRPVQRSDGTYTYFAADIAYHLDKLQRGFNNMVVLLGADHGGYIKRLKAAVSALSDEQAHIDILINQLVNLLQDGRPFKMSKRAGNFVTVREVLDLLGKDILRFVMLGRKCDTTLDLDFAKAKEQSKDNPVFYVQYAHTRACSVLAKAQEADITLGDIVQYDKLTHNNELAVIKKMAEYPRIIEGAALAHEPHRLPYYLYELATEFHALWNKGVEDPSLRFIVPDDITMSVARCALVSGAAQVLRLGMELMGVTPLEKM